MRINHNLMAMNTHRQMGINTGNSSKSIEKLSSGYRINRAGDDAAGLSISEKMRSQIRGLNQASRNAQDGISMLQTAEGALQETHAILQRMRELAVQASNDTNVDVDRDAIQGEISQLKSEIDRIADTTEFNTQSLLKGDGKTTVERIGIGELNGAVKKGITSHKEVSQNFQVKAASAASLNGKTIQINMNGEQMTVRFVQDNDLEGDHNIKIDNGTLTANTVTIRVKGELDSSKADPVAADVKKVLSETVAEALDQMIAKNGTLSGNVTVKSDGTDKVTLEAKSKEAGGTLYGANGMFGTAKASGVGTANAVAATRGITSHKSNASANFTLLAASKMIGKGFTIGDKQYEFYDANKGQYKGDAIGINIRTSYGAATAATWLKKQLIGDNFTVSAGGTKITIVANAKGEAGNGTITMSDGAVKEEFDATFQIGANKGQTMDVKIGDMRADGLGVSGVDLSTKEGAQKAVDTIEAAIKKVSTQRSSLGAYQNRLEHSIKNLDTSSENLVAAESRIRDVDMAKEMMNFQKNNILQQAAQAMLAQANQAPQGVLQLLR
ncbi:MAG: flagellin [Marinisporobacter sp.]|nr:flagellin [Marinisporobacter sp.]